MAKEEEFSLLLENAKPLAVVFWKLRRRLAGEKQLRELLAAGWTGEFLPVVEQLGLAAVPELFELMTMVVNVEVCSHY